MKKEIYLSPVSEGVIIDISQPISVSLQGSDVENYEYDIIDPE